MISPNFLAYIYDQPIYNIKDIGVLTQITKGLPTAFVDSNSEQEPTKIVTKVAEQPRAIMPIEVPVAPPNALVDKCGKNTWLLIELSNGDTVSSDEYDLLNKTMIALKQSLDEAAIFVPQELAHSYFKNLDLKGKVIVDFGMHPKNLCSTPLLPNTIYEVKNSKYLPTQSLSILQKDSSLKKDWWMQMKMLFN